MTRVAIVTGATGFLGSHLTAGLAERGWEVHVVVRPTSSLDVLGRHRSAVEVHVDDGTHDGLATALKGVEADVCFHLATHFVGRHAPDDIAPMVESNIGFPTRLADVLAGPGSPIFVNTGTIWQQVDGSPYRPAALYAASKQACQDMLQFYADEGLLRVVTLALYDTYGPGDRRRKLLTLLREAQGSGRTLPMSPGDQLIDLNYVDDVVEAFLAALRVFDDGSDGAKRYAVRSGAPVSLRRLVEVIEEVTGAPVPVEWGATPYRPREMMTYWTADPVLPGWAPTVELAEGLRRTWAA